MGVTSTLPPKPRTDAERGESHIKALSWAWIAYGGLGITCGVFGLIFYLLTETLGSGWSNLQRAPHRGPMMAFMFEYQLVIQVASLFLGSAAVLAALALKRYRRWGRSVLEGLSYVHVVTLVVFALFQIQFILHFEQSFKSGFATGFSVLMIVFQVGITLGWLVAFILSIVGLRSRTVRAALDARNPVSASPTFET